MGNVKNKIYDIAILVQELIDAGVDDNELDEYVESQLTPDDNVFYHSNKNIIMDTIGLFGRRTYESKNEANFYRSYYDLMDYEAEILKYLKQKYPGFISKPKVGKSIISRDSEFLSWLDDLPEVSKSFEEGMSVEDISKIIVSTQLKNHIKESKNNDIIMKKLINEEWDYWDYKGFKDAIGIKNENKVKELWNDFKNFKLGEDDDESERFEIWMRQQKGVDETFSKSGQILKSGFHFSNLSAGKKVKHNKTGKILTLTSVGADHAYAKDSNGKQVKIEKIKDISPINEKLVGRESPQERFIDLRGPSGNAFSILGMAQQLTKQLEEVDSEEFNWEKIKGEMQASDYNNLVHTFDKYFGDYVTIYNSDILDDKFEKNEFDDEIDESLNEAVQHTKWVGIDVDLESSLDEYNVIANQPKDKDYPDEWFVLYKIGEDKFGTGWIQESELDDIVKGDDWADEKTTKGFLTYIGLDLDEWLESDFINKLTDLVMYVGHQNIFGNSYGKSMTKAEAFELAGIETEDGQSQDFYEDVDESYVMPRLNEGCNCGGKRRPKPTKIIRRPAKLHEEYEKDCDIQKRIETSRKKMHESEDDSYVMPPLNETDYDWMLKQNRGKEQRYTHGMNKFFDKKKIVPEPAKEEYDYAERKEATEHVGQKQDILNKMGYNLDTSEEDPTKAPTRKEAKRAHLVSDNKFNRLRSEYGKEEKLMDRLHKKHIRTK